MKKLLIILLASFMILGGFSSCRNANQAKQAAKLAKELSGKVIKKSNKTKIPLQYGDDVIRHLEFVEVQCETCRGTGVNSWGMPCDDCDGDGQVYKLRTK